MAWPSAAPPCDRRHATCPQVAGTRTPFCLQHAGARLRRAWACHPLIRLQRSTRHTSFFLGLVEMHYPFAGGGRVKGNLRCGSGFECQLWVASKSIFLKVLPRDESTSDRDGVLRSRIRQMRFEAAAEVGFEAGKVGGSLALGEEFV